MLSLFSVGLPRLDRAGAYEGGSAIGSRADLVPLENQLAWLELEVTPRDDVPPNEQWLLDAQAQLERDADENALKSAMETCMEDTPVDIDPKCFAEAVAAAQKVPVIKTGSVKKLKEGIEACACEGKDVRLESSIA